MKKRLYILILSTIILATQYSCNSISKSTKDSNRTAKISNKKMEDFNTFIKRFKTDSVFQYSRINFPLIYKSVSEMDEAENSIVQIDSKDWRFLDLKYDPTYAARDLDAYTEKFVISKSSARILYQGVDNGINVEFIFELKDKKWYLIGWNDFSN